MNFVSRSFCWMFHKYEVAAAPYNTYKDSGVPWPVWLNDQSISLLTGRLWVRFLVKGMILGYRFAFRPKKRNMPVPLTIYVSLPLFLFPSLFYSL